MLNPICTLGDWIRINTGVCRTACLGRGDGDVCLGSCTPATWWTRKIHSEFDTLGKVSGIISVDWALPVSDLGVGEPHKNSPFGGKARFSPIATGLAFLANSTPILGEHNKHKK